MARRLGVRPPLAVLGIPGEDCHHGGTRTELNAEDHQHPRSVLVVLLQLRLWRACARACSAGEEDLQVLARSGSTGVESRTCAAPRELNDIRVLILEHEQNIIEAWYEHCGQR